MAHYTVTVSTTRTPHAAFAYMADLRHFAEWDPGVKRAVRVAGEGQGVGTKYDLTVKAGTTITPPVSGTLCARRCTSALASKPAISLASFPRRAEWAMEEPIKPRPIIAILSK